MLIYFNITTIVVVTVPVCVGVVVVDIVDIVSVAIGVVVVGVVVVDIVSVVVVVAAYEIKSRNLFWLPGGTNFGFCIGRFSAKRRVYGFIRNVSATDRSHR